MVRHRYVVTYDISDPKRLRAIYHTMRGFGVHVQLSVFECDLTDQARVTMEAELVHAMNAREDQVLIFDLGPTEGWSASRVAALGRVHTPVERGPVVV